MTTDKKLIDFDALTDEKKALIPVYTEEFRKIGLNIKRCDRVKAEQAVRALRAYNKQSDIPADRVFWVDSPKQMEAKIEELCRERGQSEEVIRDRKRNALRQLNYAQFSAYWMSFYAFLAEQLPTTKDELPEITRRVIEEVGFYVSASDTLIFIDRPTKLSFNNNQQGHNPDGPAIEFSDGDGVYILNGVRMPEFLWAQPKSELDPAKILQITNVEQRSEAMKWYGLDAFTKELKAVVLDTADVRGIEAMYTLLEMDLGEGVLGRYLRIVNPSTGEIHVEGVDNSCSTITEALRNRQPDDIIAMFGFDEPKYAT